MRPLVLLGVLPLSACHLSLHGDPVVNGVRLPAHHEEVLTLESWPAEGLTVEAYRGDVRVEHGDGPTTIVAEVFERELGEAHAHVANGQLRASATNGATCALGKVLVRTSGPARGLALSTGMGDVVVAEVAVEGRVSLETGLGNVELRGAGAPDSIELSSGKGDVAVARVHCARIRAETGMGDVAVDALEAEEAELSSGMGDVEVAHSKGGRVKADTGLGDVELSESSFAQRELDSGLGKVRER